MLGAMQYTKPIEEARIGCEPCKQRNAQKIRGRNKNAKKIDIDGSVGGQAGGVDCCSIGQICRHHA
jgi:hypothetical protein